MTHSLIQNSRGFVRRGQELFCEEVSLHELAQQFGTPTYVYSRACIEHNYRLWDEALSGIHHQICYAMKANSACGILQVLGRLGAGVDTVSGAEIARALRAGIKAEKIVFSGVGKTGREIRYALKKGIACFNVESESELERINDIAQQMQCVAPVSIRCNPNVDPKTHPYISTGLKANKFGIPIERVYDVYRRAAAMSAVTPIGIDAHIGSQITDPRPHADSAALLIDAVLKLQKEGIVLKHIDIGGGFGIAYTDSDTPPSAKDFVHPVIDAMHKAGLGHMTLIIEPGRSIVGNAGLLLTQIQYLKTGSEKHFCVVDAGMHNLIRPALYDAWMRIEPVRSTDGQAASLDIVGPICESSDFLGLARELSVKAGDILAVFDAGAYGASMASRYNSHALPTEILIDRQNIHVLRDLEAFEDIIAGDRLLEL